MKKETFMTEHATSTANFSRDEELQRRAVLAQKTDRDAQVAEEAARRLRKEMKRARKAYKEAKKSAKQAVREARLAQADLQACLDDAIRDLARTLQKAASTGKPVAELLEPRSAGANSAPLIQPEESREEVLPKAVSA
jgi:hypothetical protein